MVDATHRGLRSIRSLSARSGGLLLAAAVLALAAGLPFATDAAAQDATAQDATPAKPAPPAKRPTAAQQAKQMKDAKAAADAQRESAAAGQRAYAAGVKAFEGGDIRGAEQQLSVALAGGGLPNAQMARALYYRGSSYRQLGRPAQAISDLTTAVWLKGGLPEDLKTKAIEARKLAYQEAGLGNTPPPIGAAPLDQNASGTPGAPKPGTGVQVVQVTEKSFWSGISVPTLPSLGGGQPTQTAQAAAPATPPAAGAQQPSSFWNFLPSFGGGASQQPAEGVPPAAAGFSTTTVAASSEAASAPAMGFAAPPEPAQTAPSTSWDTQTASAAAAQPAPSQTVVASHAPQHDAYVPPPAASAPAPPPEASTGSSNPLSGAGQTVTGFFSNMFGSSSGGAQPAPAEGAAVTTGSTETPPGGWGGDTTVVTAQTSSMVQRGPESPPSSPPSSPSTEAMPWTTESAQADAKPKPVKVANAAPTAGSGRYKLQVAAVRSREEAQRLAQSLTSYPAVRDGTVQTEIDEAVIGSMGTFYRVRLGPYADAKEPGQLCATLKPQGFDCLVVTQ